jgi:hypothetical protein
MRVSWYTLSAGKDADAPARRLEAYLQDQYHHRVLAPVAVDIEPNAIAVQATDFYLQLLSAKVADIGVQYSVPDAQYAQHLAGIVVITSGNVNLYQLTHTQPPTKVPGYAALLKRLEAGAAASPTGLGNVAKATNTKLQGQMSTRGAGGFAAAVAGKIVGPLISLGMAGIRAIVHAGERPDTEAQLRHDLGAAFDQAWFKVLQDPAGGVMAGVNSLAVPLEARLGNPSVSQWLDKHSRIAVGEFWQHGDHSGSGSSHGL